MKIQITAAALVASLAVLAGCGGDDKEDDASATVASCDIAIPGETKLGGTGGRVSREFLQAGQFGMLRGPGTFSTAQPAGSLLDAKYKDWLIIKIPATVLGTEPVTVSIPDDARDESGLLFGSLEGYTEPLASVDFEPCEDRDGTSWPGGLAVRELGPVALLVTEEGSDEPKRLVIR